MADPSRQPTKAEAAQITGAKLELLERNEYSMGTMIVDADNDGKEDILAWNIQGTGRFVNAELYELPVPRAAVLTEQALKASMSLGVLVDPYFVRLDRVNYLVATDTGDNEGLGVHQIVRNAAGQYQKRTLCSMRAIPRPSTTCRHPACKALVEMIGNKSSNGSFAEVLWPHKYFPPAGLAAYFPENGSYGDFDNTKAPTWIWRIGRRDYVYHHIYWSLLGQGEQIPAVEQKLRAQSEDRSNPRVLDGDQHARLKRTLAQQSKVLSAQLRQEIAVPKEGQFFLFDANARTYWAWDFGEQPYGDEIHITYTNANKSDYIGMVKIQRRQALEPCASKCTLSLER